jgi:hypothetical protein
MPGWFSQAMPGWFTQARPGWFTQAMPGWFTQARPGWFTQAMPGWFTQAMPGWFTQARPGWFTQAMPGWFNQDPQGSSMIPLDLISSECHEAIDLISSECHEAIEGLSLMTNGRQSLPRGLHPGGSAFRFEDHADSHLNIITCSRDIQQPDEAEGQLSMQQFISEILKAGLLLLLSGSIGPPGCCQHSPAPGDNGHPTSSHYILHLHTCHACNHVSGCHVIDTGWKAL